jgi:hypothetical protein
MTGDSTKVGDAANVGLVDYANWQCRDCGLTGVGKTSFREHQTSCVHKGRYEEQRRTNNDNQES